MEASLLERLSVNSTNISTSIGHPTDNCTTISNVVPKTLLGILCTLPVVIVNGLFMMVLYVNRRQTWAKQLKHVTCLIVSDFIMGIVNTAIVINRFLPFCQRKVEVCLTAEYLFIATQLTSTGHIFVICLDRLLRMRSATHTCTLRQLKPWLVSLIVWAVTLTACAIPYAIWAKGGFTVPTCFPSQGLFNDTPIAAFPFLATLIMLSCLSTNVLYIVLCVLISVKLQSVSPENHVSESSTQSRRNNNDRIGIHLSFNNASAVGIDIPQVDNRPQIALYTRHQDVRNKVLKTIGLLLLALDGSVWPLLVVFGGKVFSLTFDIAPTLVLFLVLNQAINPFIYTWRIPQLRQAVAEIIRKTCSV